MTVLSKPAEQSDLEAAVETVFDQIRNVRRQIEADDADIARLRAETRELQSAIQQQELRTMELRQETQILMQELFPTRNAAREI